MQSVVETLLFYHPAVWWVSGRIRHERELCCDDLAVQHCGDAVGYARALTRLERMRAAPEPAVAGNGGSLLYRVQRLTGAVRECAPSRLPVVLAAIAAAVWIPLGAHRVQAMPQAVVVGPAVAAGSSVPVPAAAAAQGPSQSAQIQTPGTVVMDATLDAKGYPVELRVVSGPTELRNAALRFVVARPFPSFAGKTKRLRLTMSKTGVAAMTIDPDSPADERIVREMAKKLQDMRRILMQKEQEAQIEAARQQLKALEETYASHSPEILRARAQLLVMEQVLMQGMAGRRITRIERGPFAPEFALPVKIGDSLTSAALKDLLTAAAHANPPGEVSLVPDGDHGVGIRISRRQ